MRPPSDEDIENYDDIMWSFIDVLQALLDWRKVIDLQSNGETVFRVTLNFLGLLGPSQEPDIQVVRSWDELPPLPEKHPPGYWRQVWEASQAEQHQPAEEEAPPEPEEPGYWPVPPPNPVKRPPYPQPEDLFRLKPQPLASVPTIEDLLRTGDTVLQSMAAIGTVGPLFDWKATAASFDALDDFFRTAAPAKPADPSQEAASGSEGAPIAAQPVLAPAPGLFETLGSLAKGVVTAQLGPGDALGLAEAALYDAAFPNETKAFRSRVANGLAGLTEEAEGVAAELYDDALDEVQTGAALAPYLIGPLGSVPGASGIPALLERAKIDIDPQLAQGADLADKTSAAIQTALQVTSLGSAFAEGLAGRAIPLDLERPPNEPPPNEPTLDERPADDPLPEPPDEPSRPEASPEPERAENSLEQNRKIPDVRTSGLKIVPRRGMKSRVITDIHGREVPIYGQAKGSSKTTGHAEAMHEEAERMARTGDYEYVTLQRSLRTATGRVSKGRRMPDIIGVRRDGGVEQVEVRSKSDTRGELERRMKESNLTLPPHRRVDGRVIDPKPVASSED